MALKKMEPFVKWAGGKTQLIEKLHERMPREYGVYYEPFIGGGALLLNEMPQNAVIGDINEQLINAYRQIQKDPVTVIKSVAVLDDAQCDKEAYLERRKKYNEKIKSGELDADCAALMIWLNKHCFNGLYRVNSKGLFNVPYNNKQSGSSIDEKNIENIGAYLQESNVRIELLDFEKLCCQAQPGDFVYFDSPYIPISETASFTDYTKDGFTGGDHRRLAELFKRLDCLGVKVMLSNNNVPWIYELYKGYKIEPISVKRFINSDASKRVGEEVIITNYEAD